MNKFTFIFLCHFVFPILTFADVPYVVQRGDTILKIADRELGIVNDTKDPRRYIFARKIQAKNPNLKDPNQLSPGQTLVVPAFQQPTVAETTIAAPALVETPPPVQQQLQPVLPPEQPPTVLSYPSAVEEPQPEVKSDHHGHSDFFLLQPRLQSDEYKTKIIATGEKVTVKSQPIPGLLVGYGKAFGTGSHFIIEASLGQVRMKKMDDGISTIEDKSILLKTFAAGVATKLSSSLHLHVMALLADFPVILPDGTDTYTFKSVTMPGIEAVLAWHFLHLKSSALGLSVTGEYLGKGKLDQVAYSSGFEPAGSLFWETDHGSDKTNYRVDLRYNLTAQKSDDIDQHGTGLGLRVGFTFPL